MDFGSLLSIGSSIFGGLSGLGQKSEAKERLRELKDPGYVIPDEFKTNVFEAEQAARKGLSPQEYNLASTNIQRGTQAGLRQLSRMSNPFAGIAGLKRSEDDAFSRLDASNAAARRQNMLQAMGARREMAGQRLNQQQYAQRRYEEAVNEANALMGAGQQNFAGALGSLGQFGMYKSLYGNKPISQTTTQANIPVGGISTGGFNSWQLPGAMGGSVLPGNNLSGYGSRLNAINPQTGRRYGE